MSLSSMHAAKFSLCEIWCAYYLFVYFIRSPSSLLGSSFVLYAKKKGEKIPKYNKRRTVSADFHLHKFSYILVKIIAEPRSALLS